MQQQEEEVVSQLSALQLAQEAGLPTERFPETKEEADLAEEILARRMERISIDEHERILLELYGVHRGDEEDPKLMEEKRQELELELELIEHKPAYDLARSRNPSYVTSPAFTLMFIRWAQMDAKVAAEKLMTHFETKIKFFGSGDCLARDIHQSDFTEAERQVLESGFMQILPYRDACGRAIFLTASTEQDKFRYDNYEDIGDMRCVWYLLMQSLKDEETQRIGTIFVDLAFDAFKVSPGQLELGKQVQDALPVRLVCGHMCYSDPELRAYAAGFQLHASEEEQKRMRMHFGSREETQFVLQTFGIPSEKFPIKHDGTADPTEHCKWLAAIRTLEEKAITEGGDNLADSLVDVPESSPVIVPRRFDVLFGKSTFAREHTGTKRALHVVEMHFEAYNALDQSQKSAKMDMTKKIISIIHESGGRFLRQDDDGVWVVADELDAKKKIGHWLRHARHKKTQVSKATSANDGEVAPSSENEMRAKRVTPCTSPSVEETEGREETQQSKSVKV
eukprot:Nitzschia sp. Nitz4//scaffold376_size14603//10441//12059//NITZ4_008922-RA/size14603-augustus-gene-0.14-mRNA-1//1//CDS//3329549664//2496//frame0